MASKNSAPARAEGAGRRVTTTRKSVHHTVPAKRLRQNHARTQKHAFPSPRQKQCNGLRRATYPAFLRGEVDQDYVERLSQSDREFLSAFMEEHVKGWRLRAERQVLPVEAIRESAARAKRVREHMDPAAFGSLRGPSVEEMVSRDPDGEGSSEQRQRAEAVLLAGSMGISVEELSGRNFVEDELIAALDKQRRSRCANQSRDARPAAVT